MTVDPGSLHGLIRKAEIRLPLIRNLKLIDVPGLHEGDQYGHGVAEEGLMNKYGRFDSLVILFPPNGAPRDVTDALKKAWATDLADQVMEGKLQLVPFNLLDRQEILGSLEHQTATVRGRNLVEKAITGKNSARLAYLEDIFGTNHSVGIASPRLGLSPADGEVRLNLLRAAIRPMTANVLVHNPNESVPNVEQLVDLLVSFTSGKWRSETEVGISSPNKEMSEILLSSSQSPGNLPKRNYQAFDGHARLVQLFVASWIAGNYPESSRPHSRTRSESRLI
jgi:hypothetical protein